MLTFEPVNEMLGVCVGVYVCGANVYVTLG